MELTLLRTYDLRGTNGELWYNGSIVCRTIELPWLFNWRKISCIPEGRYQLTKRYTSERGWHLLVENVPGRTLILIHPANDALKQLRGCIAPVTTLTAPGKGDQSKEACEKVRTLVYKALKTEKAWLTIGEAKPALAPVRTLIPGLRAA